MQTIYKVREALLHCFRISWLTSSTVEEVFEQCNFKSNLRRQQEFYVLYIYLLEFGEFGLKEIIVFENMNAEVEVVMDSIIWILLVWASREDFKGIPLQYMYGSWEVVFKGVASAI